MNFRWNWGTKLLIAIILFMSFIFSFVYLSVKNGIDLVEKDYYPKGLKYQDRIDETQNALALKDQFRIEQTSEQVIIYYPILKADTGSITFFRPSDIKLDLNFNFDADTSGMITFDANQFKPGKYVLKVFWKDNNLGNYFEKTFYFN